MGALSAGSAAAPTGISDRNDDFSTLYAKIGTSGGTPHADYGYTSNALVATFSDASTDPGGTIGSWAWNFGDSSTSNFQNTVVPLGGGMTFVELPLLSGTSIAYNNTASGGSAFISMSGYRF